AKVDDAMFDLSQKDPTVQSAYFEAMRDLRIKRQDIEQGFQDKLKSGFGKSVKMFGVEELYDEESSLELSLVDHDELEEDIAIRDMVVKMELLVGKELSALNQRFASLLQAVE